MKVSVALILVVIFFVAPFPCQRLPRTRSRLSTAEAEAATAGKTEALKRFKSKSETRTSTEVSTKTTSMTSSTGTSPPPPSSKEIGNVTSIQTSSTMTTLEPSTATSSLALPVSSVQVRMAFTPSKKVPEERSASMSASKDDDPKSDSKSKKYSDTQEPPKEPPKKPAPAFTSSPTSTSTAKPTSKTPSTKKTDQDDDLLDALKRIHQEVLKQPRNQDAKSKSTNSTTTTRTPPKEETGLETSETTYVRPVAIHHRSQEADPSPLDAQASIQSSKFVLREQGLLQLPSFVRSKDRSLATSPNTARHILLQHRQRSQPLTDRIDGEVITNTTSTTAYPHIPIVHFDKEQSADGSYKTSYETANNIFAEETGFLKNPGVEDQEALVQQGSYSYTAPDGSLISVTYKADELGFRAAGTHLPTPPPVPPEIQRSLNIIYAQIQCDEEEAAREADEFERQGEASEPHEESLSPPTTGSKRENRRYLPKQDKDQF